MNKKRLLMLMGGNKRHTINLYPSDTYLYKVNTAINYSTEKTLLIRGVTFSYQRNTIMKFDVSSLSEKIIISAKLNLYLASNSTGNATITLHNILAANSDMVFAQMTWDVKKTGTAWAGSNGCETANTDYNSVSFGTFNVANGQTAGTKYEITIANSIITGWVTNNYGFRFVSTNADVLYQFHSSETDTASYKPALEIVYGGAVIP